MIDSISNTGSVRPDLVVFTVQITIVFVVVLACLVNLTWFETNTELWKVVLTSCLGYILPNPRFKIKEQIAEPKSNENKVTSSSVLVGDTA